MQTWQIGDIKITRVIESELPMPYKPQAPFMPAATPEALRAVPWLFPHFVNEAGDLVMSIHALLVEAPGMKLVVDTCIGNDKPRRMTKHRPMHYKFLEKFAATGCAREDVQAVVCTHLHVDHVGWNTMLQDGNWVPTFPNARYLIGRTEYEHWQKEAADEQRDVLIDSIQPIFDAQLAELVDMNHQIAPGIRLLPSPGHTPGHVSVSIESQGQRAVITGDSLHHPCQIAHPEWTVPFDSDNEAAVAMRRNLFNRWSGEDILVIGTHFATPTAGRIKRDVDAYRFET